MPSRVDRYALPDIPYFAEERSQTSLNALATYARSEDRGAQIGHLLERRLAVPLNGPVDYSPGGAAIVGRAAETLNSDAATSRWNRAVVFSPSTAILGMGQMPEDVRRNVILAGAGGPIMIGKAAYFLWSAGVNTEPRTVTTRLRPDQVHELNKISNDRDREKKKAYFRALNFAYHVAEASQDYGFINIEDSRGADLPLIFKTLKELGVDSAVWSDDEKGTAVITAAAMLSWAELTGRLKSGDKPLSGVKGVIFGSGAGAYGVYKLLNSFGIEHENMVATDSGPNRDYESGIAHALDETRDDVSEDSSKVFMRQGKKDKVDIEEFLKGADFVINLGDKRTLTKHLNFTERITRGLAPHPFFAPMTNPDPGVTPEMLYNVRADAIYASGNQLYENTVNNFTAFSYIGLGALWPHASEVNLLMQMGAALGIKAVAQLPVEEWLRRQTPSNRHEFGRYYLVPSPLDTRLIEHESVRVAVAAMESGVSQLVDGGLFSQSQKTAFIRQIHDKARVRADEVRSMREEVTRNSNQFFMSRYPDNYSPFYLKDSDTHPLWHVPPTPIFKDFEAFAGTIGLKHVTWQQALLADGQPNPTYVLNADGKEIDPKAITRVLELLKPNTVGDKAINRVALKELKAIADIFSVCPALGLALAIRRTRLVRAENIQARPTLFHRDVILDAVVNVLPEVGKDLTSLVRWADKELSQQAHLDQVKVDQALPTASVAAEPLQSAVTAGADAMPSGKPLGSIDPFEPKSVLAGEPHHSQVVKGHSQFQPLDNLARQLRQRPHQLARLGKSLSNREQTGTFGVQNARRASFATRMNPIWARR